MGRHELQRRPARTPPQVNGRKAETVAPAGGTRTREISEAKALRTITIDQIIAGASNLLIVLLALHVLGQSGGGLFAVIFLVYSLLLGVSRALVGDPLLVHPDEAIATPGRPIGADLVLGLGVGVVLFGAGFVVTLWSHELGYALIALAVCIGPLILQDLGRYLGFATKRPGRAVLLDSVWLILVIFGAAALLATHNKSLTWFVVIWGGAGGLTGALTLWQYRDKPINLGIGWIRFTWPFSWRYLISYSSNQGAALVGTSVVGAVAGKGPLGAVQATIALIRPFGTIQIAAVAAGVSGIARAKLSPRAALRRGLQFSFLTTTVAVINGIILLVLPDKIGVLIVGPAWHAAKHLLLPTAAQIVGLGVITGARAGLLGLRAVQRTVKIDVTTTVVVLVSTVAGVAANGVSGALWAVAIGQGGMAVVWWTVFRYHVRHAPDVPLAEQPEVHAAHSVPEASAIATVVADQTSVASLGTRPVRELSPWAAWR